MEFDCNAVGITPMLSCSTEHPSPRAVVNWLPHEHPECSPFFNRYSRKAISGTSVVQVPRIVRFTYFSSSEHFAVLVHDLLL